ncbi:MAG: hypothetical protein AAGA40_06610 [Cyanobacteria bacterium P01_E01_bin.45]
MASNIVAPAPYISILAILVTSGCTRDIRTDLVHHQFEVGNQAFTIALPSEFQRDTSESFVQFLIPEYRTSRSLRFTASLPPLDDSPRQTSLRHGGELRYDIATHSGGSGGIETELVGQIAIAETTIGITVTDQDEFSPNPDWCIEFLHTLRIE